MKKPWQKKEKKDAKDFGARQTPRSGGLWFAPGDCANDTFLIDSKDSKHNRFSITKLIWRKLSGEALMSKRLPLLSIEFGEGIELVVLDKYDFIKLMEEKDGNDNKDNE